MAILYCNKAREAPYHAACWSTYYCLLRIVLSSPLKNAGVFWSNMWLIVNAVFKARIIDQTLFSRFSTLGIPALHLLFLCLLLDQFLMGSMFLADLSIPQSRRGIKDAKIKCGKYLGY